MLSAVVIAFPASYPIKILCSASVPEKLAPAFVPATKLFCASGVNPPPEAVIVTIPAEIAETSKLVEKLIVPAVPTVEPSCLITTPEPDAVMPVSPEPSPVNLVAVRFPVLGLYVKPVSVSAP